MAEPVALFAGVYVRVPLGLTAGCSETKPLLLLLKKKLGVAPDSPAGPAEMLVPQFLPVCAIPLPGTDWSAPFVNEGASLTAMTLIAKVCGADVSLPPL